jgi:GT2 family glycosyltransferase
MHDLAPHLNVWTPARSPWWLRAYRFWRCNGLVQVIKRAWLKFRGPRNYNPDWVEAYDTLAQEDVELIRERIQSLPNRPFITVLIPPAHRSPEDPKAAIRSVIAQIYTDWELFVLKDSNPAVAIDFAPVLEIAEKDPRVQILTPTDNADAASARNQALAAATGDYCLVLETSGRLSPHALYMVAEQINDVPAAGLIYSDEDRVDADGVRSNPYFKSDWNPDLFLSADYLGNLCAYARPLALDVGGYRHGFQDQTEYDLRLRIVERLRPNDICHIPFVLYHEKYDFRPKQAFTKEGQRAIEEHLIRVGTPASVQEGLNRSHYRILRALPTPAPLVSLIIPTRDSLALIRGALESICERTDYPNYEIVIVDNQSRDAGTLDFLSSIDGHSRVRVLRYQQPFNYSAINNFAARHCNGSVLGLLNNDVIIINSGWLTELVAHALRPEIGAVGAMLYYPDDTIQHAGIVIGFSGSAINCFNGLQRGAPGYHDRAQLVQNYSAVTGACLFTRASVFAEVGGLNESDLPVSLNDVDYCLRLRELGYLIVWTPYAELYHLESISRGDDRASDKIGRFRHELTYFESSWAHILLHDPYYNANLSLDEWPFQLGVPRCFKPWRRQAQSPCRPAH